VFYIERGLVKLMHISENGEESAIDLPPQGSLMGAASVIVQEPYPFTAITITSCALSCIPADLFLRLAKTDEQFCWYLHEVHSHEVHRQASQLAAIRHLSARQRFERLLLQFISSIPAHEKQSSMKIRLPLKHWEIAQLIGIRPEHLSRVLQQIKQEGVLREENGCMIVSDVNKLHGQSDCD
jgi:CRP/FNR family transcriptional regulator